MSHIYIWTNRLLSIEEVDRALDKIADESRKMEARRKAKIVRKLLWRRICNLFKQK